MRQMSEVLEELVTEFKRLNKNLEEKQQTLDVLYTPSEAALYLKVTRQTVCNYARKGILHKVVRAGREGFLKSELDNTKPA